MESRSGILAGKVEQNYLDLGKDSLRETLQVSHPMPEFGEEIEVGNAGFKQYRYRVQWKADTVVKLEPIGNNWQTGYSEFDRCQVPIYYGMDGPARLYRRDFILRPKLPQPASLQMDTGELDFWWIKK